MIVDIRQIALHIRLTASREPKRPTTDFLKEFGKTKGFKPAFRPTKGVSTWGQMEARNGVILTVPEDQKEELTRWQRLQTLHKPKTYHELFQILH